jgi:hypothetical protein
MRRGGAWLAALIAFGASARAGAQHAVQIEAPARAEAARVLRAAIAGPHDIIATDSTRRLILPRGTELPRTTIVIGGPASVGARVRGDIIVVSGDLFLQPGAAIDGRATAIGGAVYGSTLATVTRGTQSFRDGTFDATTTSDGIRLAYRNTGGRDPAFEFPLLDGLRIPSYDRVEGASVPWGPVLRPTTRLEVEPIVTYRSHIGAWDPGVHAVAKAGDIWHLTLDARRGTFTNDGWIQSDLINSFNTLVVGNDTRNYYRADRAQLATSRVDRTVTVEVETSFGVVTERAWSVGSPDTLGSRPWSLKGRGDADNLPRANPRVQRGRISAAFVGSAVQWLLGDVRLAGTGRIEVPWQAPDDVRFAQITADAAVQFPTFGLQRFRADVHLVATPGDTAPPQRFAYLGGSGTLPVIDDPLVLGGDQLLLVDSRYEIPLPGITLPFAGSPTLAIRHRAGSAGVQRLPRLVQNVGAMVTLSFFRVEYAVDPATRKQFVGASLSFAR